MTPLTDVEKIRRLPWLLTAEAFNAAFCILTFAGTVFLLFLHDLGLNEGQIGFLLSLIPFCGIVAPFIAPGVARLGYKRVYVAFWGIRKFVFALLLLTPAFVLRFGSESAFIWVTAIIFVFGMCRAIAEVGGYPWRKEAIPASIQGKFGAVNNITATLASIIATVVASYVIGWGTGLNRYLVLMAVGVGLGLVAVWAFAYVPGGAPVRHHAPGSGHLSGMREALRDRDFLFFLSALGLATIGSTAVISFVPLFMKEEIGLNDSQIVLQSIGTYAGALLSSYLWGWAADRYGSKPVMQFSIDLMLLLPVAWFLMPRHSPFSSPVGMGIAFIAGMGTLAWQISWLRYLFVNAMPAEKKTSYTAIYYAWYSIVGGLAPLLAGQVLELAQGIRADFFIFTFDPYTPLFLLSFAFLAVGLVAVTQLRSDEATPFRRFAGMFVRGNPIRALESLIQYNFAGDEMTRIATTERMGDAKNPLSTRELIEALRDPSFSVRFEAIHSIGRMPPEPELVDALIALLDEGESELTFIIIHSLGRLGDPKAILPLRKLLFSGYHLIEADSARALAMLGDTASVSHFLDKFRNEPNQVLRIAYASALGKLRATEATGELFALLRQTQGETLRAEIGLALARLAGDERYYMQQWRLVQANPPTATAQAVLALQKLAKQAGCNNLTLLTGRCAENFAQDDLAQGTTLLKEMICEILRAKPAPPLNGILQECANNLAEFGPTRLEFILLSLHTLHLALPQLHATHNGRPN
ncbi:MAG: MFS transporter [Anaerolineales bacterium]|nr:MFS transporter [Anaerolineales bacterium]